MRSVPEGQVLARAGALHLELGGALELARIAVGGAVDDHHGGTRRDLGATDGGGRAREAEVALDGALEPEALLHEVRDQLPLCAQLLLKVVILGETLQRGSEEADAR